MLLAAVAVLVGCGSSSKATTSAAVKPSPTVTGLDASARVACSRADDALANFHENPTDYSNQLYSAGLLVQGLTPAATSQTVAVRDAGAKILAGRTFNDPDAKQLFVNTGFEAKADMLRDACIGAGWQSTTSG